MSDKEPAVEKIAEEGVRDAEQGLTGVAPPPEHHGHHEHKKRTLGNRIFDLAVWPTIAFGAVYGLSTWAVKAAEQKEGSNWVKSLHEKLSSTFAKMYTEEPVKKGNALSLVILSFAVGTALMAPIKLLEDRRQKISQWIDHKLGTEPADPSHYKKEPKQTWGSVLGGRLVTFLSVMGINAAVGKHTDAITEKAADIVKERWKKINPAVTEQRLKDVHPWIKANAFELFYTTVCASMVYFLSRAFARVLNKREEEHHHPATPAAAAPADETAAKGTSWQEKTSSQEQTGAREKTDIREKIGAREQPRKNEGFVQAVDGSRSGLASQAALS